MANGNRKRAAKRTARAASAAAKRNPRLFWTIVIVLVIFALLLGVWWYFFRYRPSLAEKETAVPPVSGELSIHFLETGNRYAGDCIYIKAGSTDVLIDGGSRESSADTIQSYVDAYCEDGILEYVIVTHADQDHIAAFSGNETNESLFERYECGTIIDFPRTNKDTQVYKRYVAARDREVAQGAAHYTALQCYRETDGARRVYDLDGGVTMNFLYNYYYEHDTGDENNYSVCMYLRQGDDCYLFTGDLEEKGEEYLVQYNRLPHCKLFKAGHHGSNTSSSRTLLDAIRPEYVCVCCCAGSPEYTQNPDNTFPTRAMIERVREYTDLIYVTTVATDVDLENKQWDFAPLNGNIVVTSSGGSVTVTGSNHSVPLPETDWFRANRS